MMVKVTSKPAGKQLVKGGPKGGMAGFKGAGAQKPGVSSVESGDGGGKFAKGGSGKMAGFTPVNAQKSGRSGQR
jgi:hypothetical protein